MTDTSPEFAQFYFDKIMSLSPKERLRMGSSLYDTAREIVLSSLPENMSETEKKVQLFLRFYENDFTKEQLEKIIKRIRNSPV
jgi:hypothetical protein